MSTRIKLARTLQRAGRYIMSLAVTVMRPDDLVAFSRETYAAAENVDYWAGAAVVDGGLMAAEKELLERLPEKQGNLLVLGCGGGREAIVLARSGFNVTCVDFIAPLVERCIRNGAERGVTLKGVVQEISQLNMPPASFDVVWLSCSMYSSVPTRKRRVAMLRRIRACLRPGGRFACQFRWDPVSRMSAAAETVRKVFARLSLGNFEYETGDTLWLDGEFIHNFRREQDVRDEFDEAGYEIEYMHVLDSDAGEPPCCGRRPAEDSGGRVPP